MATFRSDRQQKQYDEARAALKPGAAAPAEEPAPVEEALPMEEDQPAEDQRLQSIEDRLAAIEAQLGIGSPEAGLEETGEGPVAEPTSPSRSY